MDQILETICEAGRVGRRLAVVYCGSSPAGVETTKTVEPYRFVASGKALQLWCWCDDAVRGRGFRTLTVARITSAKITAEAFMPAIAVSLKPDSPAPNPSCRKRKRQNRPGIYSGVMVCPTGFRFDVGEQQRLSAMGFEFQERLTSDADLLVCKALERTSEKVLKASGWGIPTVVRDEFGTAVAKGQPFTLGEGFD